MDELVGQSDGARNTRAAGLVGAGLVGRPAAGDRQLAPARWRLVAPARDRPVVAGVDRAARLAACAPGPGQQGAAAGDFQWRQRHRPRERGAQPAFWRGDRKTQERRQRAFTHRGRQFAVCAALVCLRGCAGLGQDHRAAKRRAAVLADRGPDRRPGQGCRRHAQLRLVVHQRGGADRHRRSLHHPGIRFGGRRQGLGQLPGAVAQEPPAPAHQWRAADHQHPGPAAAKRHRTPRTRAKAACAAARPAGETGGACAGLCADNQDRPGGGFQRNLRCPGQGAARPGVGLQFRRGRHRHGGAGVFRQRIHRARRAPQQRLVRAAAGRTRRRQAHQHVRFSGRVRQPAAGPGRVHGPGVLQRRRAAGRTTAARRLFHQRNPGGHTDRPGDGRLVADLRIAGARASGGGPARKKLLPAPPVAGRDLPGTRPGGVQPGRRAAPLGHPYAWFWRRRAGRDSAAGWLGLELHAQPGLCAGGRPEAARTAEGSRYAAAGPLGRHAAVAAGPDGGAPGRRAVRVCRRRPAVPAYAGAVPGRQARCGGADRLPPVAGTCVVAARRRTP